MNGISTHILDTSAGRPVPGVPVRLFVSDRQIGSGVTNRDGRCPQLLPDEVPLAVGTYRLSFEISSHFADGFYPEINVTFRVQDASSHYHVPLLVSAFGFTTYRGS